MNWTELVKEIASESSQSERDVRQILDAMVSVTTSKLLAGEDVPVRGLGTISSRWRAARTLRSVQDQRKIMLDGRFVPRFRPSKSLRDAVAGRTPQHWRDPQHQAAWRIAETLVGDLALYHAGRAPSAVTENTPPSDVRMSCVEAFGPLWAQVERTYAQQVAGAVRSEGDYLGLAARRAFASS